MPYTQLYYHLIWATKNRDPLITPDLEPALHQYLRGKGLDLGGVVHAVGGIEDHIHVVASIPSRIAVATYIGQLKGASSHWVSQVSGYTRPFAWQEGYGAISFSKRSLPQVVEYAQSQRDRHRTGRIIPAMERIEAED